MSELTYIISLAGCFFGFTISLVIFFLKRSDKGTKLLAIYLFLLTLSLAEPLFEDTLNGVSSFPFGLFVGGLNFLLGPALYLYCKFRIAGEVNQRSRDYVHLIPFICYSLLIAAYSLTPETFSNSLVETLGIVLYELLFIQFFAYAIKSLIIVRKCKTDEPRKKVIHSFLKVMVMISFSIFLTSFLFNHFFLLAGIEQTSSFHTLIQFSLIFCLALFVLLNSESMHMDKLIQPKY